MTSKNSKLTNSMRTVFKFCAGTIAAASLFLEGCDRRSSTKQEEGTRIHPGGIAEESAQWGYLALRIVKDHQNQKALDAPPWFAAGGDWIFLECEADKEPAVHILIGTRMRSAPKGDVPISWGEAMIAVTDTAAGARFIESFAKAFHQKPPPSYGQRASLQVKMQTAVMGTGLIRDPHGGFKDGRQGRWTATKWFLQDETAEAEVFFNYSIAEKRAEFSEKDEDYREDLIQQLVVGLRDGPLPERTTENDPNLTLVGPKVANWARIADSSETCQFGPKGDTVAITASDGGSHSKLFIAPTARPSARKLLAEFEGFAQVQEFLSLKTGVSLLVMETIRKDSKAFSTADPKRLWLVDAQAIFVARVDDEAEVELFPVY